MQRWGVDGGKYSWASENYTARVHFESHSAPMAGTTKVWFLTLIDDILILKLWVPVSQTVLVFVEEAVLLLQSRFGLYLL